MATPFRVAFVPGVTPGKWLRTWEQRRLGPLEAFMVEQDVQREVLYDGTADMCFVRQPVDRDGLHLIPLYSEVPVVVVPKEHPASVFESAPGYVAVTVTCTGVIVGYCATGSSIMETAPASAMMIATTAAKIGRSMKKRENMRRRLLLRDRDLDAPRFVVAAAARHVHGGDEPQSPRVDAVFVAGQVKKWAGRLVAVDLARIARLAEQSRDSVLERAGWPKTLLGGYLPGH